MTHPARYSPPIIDLVADILRARWPDFMGRPIIHDPFAGTGERLHEMCNRDDMLWAYSGTEIEECFIAAPGVFQGDATDPDTYPPARLPAQTGAFGWIVFTSPVYPNGMADNHRARDSSNRRNYRAAKIKITGDADAGLEENNAGNFGYRGTKRDGNSARRINYWRIHEQAVRHWSSAQLAIVNVSDFIHSKNQVEPLVDDWIKLLADHGWDDQQIHRVKTSRMRHGENREQRVDHEVVIVARKDTP